MLRLLPKATTAAVFFLPALLLAQPVIHPRDIPSRPGMELAYWTAADSVNGIEVDVGQSGEDRVWDLTAYQFETVTFDTLVDPQAAPDTALFPTANRVLLSATNDLGLNLGSGHQYEVVADSGWYMLGLSNAEGLLGQAIVFPTPMKVLPMPAEFGADWNIGLALNFGFPFPDSLRALLGDLGDLADLIDSVYIRVSLGGTSSIDGWGTVRFSGGEVSALRQSISTGGIIGVFVAGTIPIINRRFEEPVPGLGDTLQTTRTYRWFAAGVGEIASMTSRVGDNDPNFNLAAQVRVRRIIPQMTFPQDPLVFGEVQVGNSRASSLYFSNHGEGVGIISRVEFSGGLESEIEVLTALPEVIEKDSTSRLRFLWTPAVERTLEGEFIRVYHNDPTADNPLTIPMEGFTPDFNSINSEGGTVICFSLSANYPNPFNSSTLISYDLPLSTTVRLSVRDLSGREVALLSDRRVEAGRHEITWNASAFPSGLYLLRLDSPRFHSSRKLVLVR